MQAAEIETSTHGPTLPVAIIRDGKTIDSVLNYTPLYPGDQIYVKDPTARITVELNGGDVSTFGGSDYPKERPLKISPVQPALWDTKSLKALLALFPNAFAQPKTRPAQFTTANATRGSEAGALSPTELLPASPQTLATSSARVALPVVWRGGPAHVRLTRDCRSVVIEQTSERSGFFELSTTAMHDGDYCIDVWPVDGAGKPDRKAGFSIPVKFTATEPPTVDEQTAVLAAAKALRGPPEGRLQGLVNLDRQAHVSFKAWAIFRGISLGATP